MTRDEELEMLVKVRNLYSDRGHFFIVVALIILLVKTCH